MSITKKILFAASTIILVMLIFPVLAVNFTPGDAGLAIAFLLFFVINKLNVLGLVIIAGTVVDVIRETVIYLKIRERIFCQSFMLRTMRDATMQPSIAKNESKSETENILYGSIMQITVTE